MECGRASAVLCLAWCNFFILFCGTLFLSKGGERFFGATTCNFSFPYFNSIRVISPKNVNVNVKEKEKKTGRSSKVVSKGMQSLQRKINADSAESKRRRSS
jgi:hypothetical protein